ncbi:ACS family hexuronate transporter-like MFS transporter [Dysgonomonas hofstadii]|uniref:ACS family hexuronate transporter-like MFS transporter n=1 Tax=Dysgonomonas hofstadii TaxID=637886 RepID=A0A840CN71_9BACT|nr:MFS transporter [Dysgonomonas hofstadii]MBB4036836.1 ACS family hexuronate transporter-like MFS transporter [Dysgonomonas hofstadii]
MKIKGLRWVVLGLIALVAIINYLDRGTLNYMWVANQKIEYNADKVVHNLNGDTYTLTAEDGSTVIVAADKVTKNDNRTFTYTNIGGIARDLGIVDASMSDADFKAEAKRILANITIFFMIAYGISQLVSGKLYDKIGTRKGFVFSALLWGAADAFTSLAGGLKSLMGFRFALGLGEAGPWPGNTKSNAEWFPTKERALAQGIFNAATSVGSILAPIVISFLFLAFGWRLTFVVVGSLAIVWIIPWLIINKKSPKEHPWITDKEKEYILSGQPESKQDVNVKPKTWKELLSKRKNYALIVGRFFLDPVWWIFVTFIPMYLIEVFNLDIKEVALSAWVPYVGAAIGAFTGGWFSGLLMRKGKSLNFARKIGLILGACIAVPGIIGATMASTPYLAVSMMAVILAGYQFSATNLMTLASDFHNGKTVGSLAGIGGASAVLGTITAMVIIPLITKVGWLPFFIFAGLLFPLAIIAVFVLGGRIEPIKDDEK